MSSGLYTMERDTKIGVNPNLCAQPQQPVKEIWEWLLGSDLTIEQFNSQMVMLPQWWAKYGTKVFPSLLWKCQVCFDSRFGVAIITTAFGEMGFASEMGSNWSKHGFFVGSLLCPGWDPVILWCGVRFWFGNKFGLVGAELVDIVVSFWIAVAALGAEAAHAWCLTNFTEETLTSSWEGRLQADTKVHLRIMIIIYILYRLSRDTRTLNNYS